MTKYTPIESVGLPERVVKVLLSEDIGSLEKLKSYYESKDRKSLEERVDRLEEIVINLVNKWPKN